MLDDQVEFLNSDFWIFEFVDIWNLKFFEILKFGFFYFCILIFEKSQNIQARQNDKFKISSLKIKKKNQEVKKSKSQIQKVKNFK